MAHELDPFVVVTAHDFKGERLGANPRLHAHPKPRFQAGTPCFERLSDVGSIDPHDAVEDHPVQFGPKITHLFATLSEHPPTDIRDLLAQIPINRLVDKVSAEVVLKHETSKQSGADDRSKAWFFPGDRSAGKIGKISTKTIEGLSRWMVGKSGASEPAGVGCIT